MVYKIGNCILLCWIIPLIQGLKLHYQHLHFLLCECNARSVYVLYKKTEIQIKALSVLCPFLFSFSPGARCSRLASLIEVIGRWSLIEVSLYPIISSICKAVFLCCLWFGVISVEGTCEAVLLYSVSVFWISDCLPWCLSLCLFFFVFQVSSRCQSP